MGDYCRCVDTPGVNGANVRSDPQKRGFSRATQWRCDKSSGPCGSFLSLRWNVRPVAFRSLKRLEHFHRMLNSDGEMAADLVRSAIGVPTAPPRPVPDGGSANRPASAFSSRRTRSTPMRGSFRSHRAAPGSARTARCGRAASDAPPDTADDPTASTTDRRGRPAFQLRTFPRRGDTRESHRRLHLEGFTHDVMSLDIFG